MLLFLIILVICSIRSKYSCLNLEIDAIDSPTNRSKRDGTPPPEVDYIWNKLHTAGHWASWGPWTCDALCGRGAYFRKRHCVPSDDFGLPVCKGKTVERNKDECKVKCPGLSEIRRKFMGPKLTEAEMQAQTKLLSSHHGAFQRKVGGSIQLDCYNLLTAHFLSNYSRSVLYWEKNGQKLRFDFNRMDITDYSILAIANLETSDSGAYACKMELMKSLHITIMVFSLIVIGKPYDLLVTANTALKVKCNGDVIVKLFSGIYVQWIVNNTENVLKDYVVSTSPDKLKEDIIDSFSETETGLWMCVVKDRISNRTWITNAFYVKVVPSAFVAACRRILEHIPLQWLLFIIGCFIVLVVSAMYFTIRRKRKRKQKLLRRLNDILKISAEIDEDFAKEIKIEDEKPTRMILPKVIVKTKSHSKRKPKARNLKEKIRIALRKISAGKREIKPLKDAIEHHDMASALTSSEKHKRHRIKQKTLNSISSESSMEEPSSSSESLHSDEFVEFGRTVVTRRDIEIEDMDNEQTFDMSEDDGKLMFQDK